jgi:hypothetical protein
MKEFDRTAFETLRRVGALHEDEALARHGDNTASWHHSGARFGRTHHEHADELVALEVAVAVGDRATDADSTGLRIDLVGDVVNGALHDLAREREVHFPGESRTHTCQVTLVKAAPDP